MQNKIISYINILKKEDIMSYCKKNNISISNGEIDILYYYIKNKYKDFFNKPELILKEIKPKISDSLFKKIKELYDKYKLFIN